MGMVFVMTKTMMLNVILMGVTVVTQMLIKMFAEIAIVLKVQNLSHLIIVTIYSTLRNFELLTRPLHSERAWISGRAVPTW